MLNKNYILGMIEQFFKYLFASWWCWIRNTYWWEEIITYLEMLFRIISRIFYCWKPEKFRNILQFPTSIHPTWMDERVHPYSYSFKKLWGDEKLQRELNELHSDWALEMWFETNTLEEFWSAALDMVPRLESVLHLHSICNNTLVWIWIQFSLLI